MVLILAIHTLVRAFNEIEKYRRPYSKTAHIFDLDAKYSTWTKEQSLGYLLHTSQIG